MSCGQRTEQATNLVNHSLLLETLLSMLTMIDHIWESRVQLVLDSLFLTSPGPWLPVTSGHLAPVGSCLFQLLFKRKGLKPRVWLGTLFLQGA